MHSATDQLSHNRRIDIPQFSASKLQLSHGVPFSTSLLAGVPIGGLDPAAQDVLSCRLDGATFVHKILSYSHSSPFPLTTRASSVLQNLLCIEKFALNSARVLGQHIAELRKQQSTADFQRSLKTLKRLLPTGHGLTEDTFEVYEELWQRLSLASDEATLQQAIAVADRD